MPVAWLFSWNQANSPNVVEARPKSVKSPAGVISIPKDLASSIEREGHPRLLGTTLKNRETGGAGLRREGCGGAGRDSPHESQLIWFATPNNHIASRSSRGNSPLSTRAVSLSARRIVPPSHRDRISGGSHQ